MEDKIQKRIVGVLRDLHDFHQNTYHYEPYKNKKELTGREISDYVYNMEMTRQEDACYLCGKLDAYEDMMRECPMLFTPIDIKTGKRLKMQVKYTDVPRGEENKGKSFTVETMDGRKYECRVRACSLPDCYCDAELIKEIIE